MTPATVTGHFGEWVQGRFGPEGPVVLITLPCPDFRVTAPGDDTMAFSASALSFLMPGLSKPVIFTGSQVPLSMTLNDALTNLVGAIVL
ncbi:asparaginase domain-containing protein, partial [uncultured Alcanivorax sp.]|uniref:asparaginase domain-containing protein n=1 Tax=uncultured Alcanivorax sp. TaxID=191215 RepID=UPI00343D6A9A